MVNLDHGDEVFQGGDCVFGGGIHGSVSVGVVAHWRHTKVNPTLGICNIFFQLFSFSYIL